MGCRCGIVGLPNVGKSTLFNALTNTMNAEAADFPFCTIEPNVGIVSIPDERLQKIADISCSAEVKPSRMKFVDIAGLVKGASRGDGLGNKFLGNIREVDTIVHVVRCFQNDDITHVSGEISPLSDIDTIETELMLADLDSAERQLANLQKARNPDPDKDTRIALLEKALVLLRDGRMLSSVIGADEDGYGIWKSLQFLTAKPVMFVCNVSDEDASDGNDFVKQVSGLASERGNRCITISAQIECEIANIPDISERKEFLYSLGLSQSGLDLMISESFSLLNLITYFTSGPKETRSWVIPKGFCAAQAAGVIHSDFERGFIRAETISYDNFISYHGEVRAKENGKMRLEGKDYIVQDGDVMHFRFSV